MPVPSGDYFDFKEYDNSGHHFNKEDWSSFFEAFGLIFGVMLLIGGMNAAFSSVKDKVLEIKENRHQQKNQINSADTIKMQDYMMNTHQISIFQDTTKTR